MEVILLEKMGRLGNLGDKVSVKAGFGRNYLMPQGKAVSATADNLKDFEARRAELEAKEKEILAQAQTRAEKLKDLTVSITTRASEEGKLFGSVGTREIAEAVNAAGHDIAKSEIRLPTGAIRTVGEFEVALHLHSDVEVMVAIHLVAEE